MVTHPFNLEYLDLKGGKEFVQLEISNPDQIRDNIFENPMIFEASRLEQGYLASFNRSKMYFFGGRLQKKS